MLDKKPLFSLSGVSNLRWDSERIQRQIHEQSIRAARRILCIIARSLALDLSKFFLSAGTLAVCGDKAGGGISLQVLKFSSLQVFTFPPCFKRTVTWQVYIPAMFQAKRNLAGNAARLLSTQNVGIETR